MSYQHQSFSCGLSHASLERPPQCGSLDHVTDAVNMIGRWPLIDDHMHTPEVRAPMKQPQDTDEKQGLVVPQCQEHGPYSLQEVSNILTIVVGLHRINNH
jgi:hypothetical protein